MEKNIKNHKLTTTHLYKIMIGDKLRDWGIKNFGSLNAFAKALDMY